MTEFTISLDNATAGDVFEMLSEVGAKWDTDAAPNLAAFLPFLPRFTQPYIKDVAALPAADAAKLLRFITQELVPLMSELGAEEKNSG